MANIEERGWWMVQTTLLPLPAKSLSADITFCAWNESNPDVGSSRKIAAGSRTISTPMLHRFRSPPLSPRRKPPGDPTGESLTFFNPSSAMSLSTLSAFSLSGVDGGKRSLAWSMNVSCTVRNAKSSSSCITYATRSLKSSDLACPFTVTSPLRIPPAGTRPERTFSRLVLPLPVGPMSAMTWWGRAAPLRPLRMSREGLSLPAGYTVYQRSRHARVTVCL
mmetsp:Transcript_10323/g.40331  ORF Transcript_10323/g.40331 Transcript_10323/m.40331 type:complete len:221 (-) Transcript_10323:179-841(-)